MLESGLDSEAGAVAATGAENLLDALGDNFYAVDERWRVTFLSKAAANWFQLEREKAIGRDLWALVPGLVGTEFERRCRGAMAAREAAEFAAPSALYHGRWLEARIVPMGHGLAVAFRDTTEQVNREAGLRRTAEAARQALRRTLGERSEEERLRLMAEKAGGQLRLALEAGRMAVWHIKAGVLAHSVELNRVLGHPDEATPSVGEVIACFMPGEIDRMQTLALETLAKGERFFEVEALYRRPDGAARWLMIRAEMILDEAGQAGETLGVVFDVTDRKAAEERLKLLAREVDHRANNLLAVVQATVTLSQAANAEALRQTIQGRLRALAGAHRLLSLGGWKGADIRGLLTEELSAYGPEGRIAMDGPPLELRPELAQGVALAIHELATNALKYGALSRPEGRVDLQWRIEDGELRLAWSETGGPPVEPVTRKGFGHTLLARALGGSLGGECGLEMRPQGVVCRLAAPLRPAPSDRPVALSHPLACQGS